MAGKATVEAKETAKIAATKADIAAVQAEIDTAYTAIGRAYVETALAGKEICDIGCAATLKALEPKLERMQELQKELIALEKALDESQLLQERQLIQAEVDEAKAKLDKAKAMGVISEDDYNAKLAHEMKKIDCYQELRNLKKQKEMGIISESEMQEKVKRYLSQIAPNAETRNVLLDTQELAYSNDGADSLRSNRSSREIISGDRYSWFDLQDGTKSEQLSRRRRSNDMRHVLVIDQIANGGAETHGTVFALTNAQYAKFTDWIEQNVLRARPSITVVAMDGNREILAEQWDMHYLASTAFSPVEDVCYGNGRFHVVSPWVAARDGVRCAFLGVCIRERKGLPGSVSFKWSL